MNENQEMLNYIHQNAEMGQDSINKLLEIVDEDSEFKQLLQSQFNEYKIIFDESEKLLNDMNKDAKGINKLQKMETYMMINMKTMRDKSPDHISEMLMQGSTMGIVQIIRRIKKYDGIVDRQIINLGKKLLETEQRNLDECKKFLGATVH